MSTIEAIERRQEYEQMKRKKDAERKHKEETKKRLAELAEERKMKQGYAQQALQQQQAQQQATSGNKTPPSSTTSSDDCILQIRMVGGATIKHTFKATDTMQVVYDYVQSMRTDVLTSQQAFSLTAFPKKEYKPGNLDITLSAAGLTPRGQLVMNLSGVEQKQAATGADVSTMYFQSLLHQTGASSVQSGRTLDLTTKPVIVICYASRPELVYVEKQLARVKKLYPTVCFGQCDIEEKSDLATKQGITTSGTFHIYKGMEKIDEIIRDVRGVEESLRKHSPAAIPTISSITYHRTHTNVTLPRHTPISFKIQLQGSPAKGLFWDVISHDPHITRVGTWTYVPKNESLEDDADGIDGLFTFTFLYHPTPTTTSTSSNTTPQSIVFHYTKPWRHDAPPLDTHTFTWTYEEPEGDDDVGDEQFRTCECDAEDETQDM